MSTISVDYDVLNQRGSPAWFTDTFANIPTAGYVGRMFISKDTFAFYRDTGTGWDLIGGPGIGTLTGSGVVGQVSFFNGTQVLAGNNNLFWDNTNSRLGINTTTPGAPLDIHGTGTNAQFNGTGTNNAYLVFQIAGTSKWKIGNSYGGGNNNFDIINATTSATALSINNTTNISTFGADIYISPSSGQAQLNIKQTLSGNQITTGFTSIWSTGNNIFFAMSIGVTLSKSGYLDFSGLTNNTTRSYAMPDANGTLALTSDLTTGYVPYTGATQSVNIGAFSLLSSGFLLNQSGSASLVSGYTTIRPQTGSGIYGFIIDNGNTGINQQLLFNNAASYIYTFPNATGTISLTSDLSSYLPLTGGTLTGALVINPTNTLTIGLDVASNTTRFRSDNLEGFKRQLEITMGSGTLVQLTAKGYLANYGTDMAFYTATTSGTNASPGIYITGTNNRVGIKTGLPAYDLDVAGTFGVSGLLTATGFGANSFSAGGTGNNKLTLRNTTAGAANGAQLSVGTDADPDQFYIGSFSTTYTTSGMNVAGGAVVNGEGPGGLNLAATQSSIGFYTNGAASGNLRMTIGSGGQVAIGDSVNTAYQLLVKSTTTTSASYALILRNSNPSNLFYVRSDNYINVGTGAVAPYNYGTTGRSAVLELDGSFGYLVSTRESKENIEPIKNINFILQLNPVQYNYRKKNINTNTFTNEFYNNITYGFIADEVEKVNKELVFYNQDNTLAGVEYNSMIAILTKAIQELNEKLVRNNIN